MNLSVIKDLNLLKLSAAGDLIAVDLKQDKARIILAKRKESFTKVRNGDIDRSLSITETHSCPLDEELHILGREIKSLIKKHSLKDPLIIAGIDEFRYFQIPVPIDTEDVELWLLENSGKFLPEGRPKDEFTYSFDILRQDETYFYYNLIVARKDYLKRLESSLTIEGSRLFSIMPFPFAVLSNAFTKDNTCFYISLTESSLTYSALSAERLFGFGELYNEFIKNGTLNTSIFQNELDALKEIIYPVIKNDILLADSLKGVQVILEISVSFFQQAEHIIKSAFPNAKVNEPFRGFDPSLTGSIIGLNHIFNSTDSSLNLLKDDQKVRFSLEKQLTMRLVLFMGMMLISVLLLFFVTESWLSGKLQELEDTRSDILSKSAQVEDVQKENRYLKSNLGLISSLKGSRAKYTSLLYDMTKVVSSKSSLTGVKFKAGEGKSNVACEISGLAFTQEEVAKVVERMEKIKSFKNVSLLFAGYPERQNSYDNTGDEKNKMIHFNISAAYDAD